MFMWCVSICAVLRGPPVEDGSIASVTAVAAEAGAILPVQRCGSHSADVHVCPARPLDGLCVVFHWSQGDRKSWLLGYWSVHTLFNHGQKVEKYIYSWAVLNSFEVHWLNRSFSYLGCLTYSIRRAAEWRFIQSAPRPRPVAAGIGSSLLMTPPRTSS